MSWYKFAKQIFALRKHTMRVDLHTHCGDYATFKSIADIENSVKAMLLSAITKGLDVIGIVAHDGPQVGIQAQIVSKKQGYDLYVVAGHEYICADKIRLIAFNIQQPIPPSMHFQEVLEHVHKQHGVIMALDLATRQSQQMNSLKGTDKAPDMVEIYNAAVGGYRDVPSEYPRFISSAAKSANELTKANVYTFVHRKIIEDIGLIPKDEGVDYTPQYLQHDDEIQSGVNYHHINVVACRF